jgi:6-phosphogluconolactonase/glucosamine-6-phosphate isomerase/deaminase
MKYTSRLLIMLQKAREIVVIVTGAQKALALQKCIEGGVNHMYTLSALQMHPHSMVVCDEDATLELQVKTVKVRNKSVINTMLSDAS